MFLSFKSPIPFLKSRNSLVEPGPSSSPTRPTQLAAPSLNGKTSSGWSSSFSTIAQPVPLGPRSTASAHSNRERQPPQPSSEPPPSASPIHNPSTPAPSI